jgi:putative transcriptional regulator
VPTAPSRTSGDRAGFGALRRSGAVSDLLFLYECETREVGQLRAVAEALGLTVQAASHTYRSLRRRGLVEIRSGRYKPTVRGVDWLHASLGSVRDDLAHRLDRLHIVRTTRALASDPIALGDEVGLELRDGVLLARQGPSTGSRGRAHSPAAVGDLVDVGDLQGIVPLPQGRVVVVPVPSESRPSEPLVRFVRQQIARHPNGLLLAYGLEGLHLLRRARPRRPIIRFGVAAAITEATRLGVDCFLVVADRDLPRLFGLFSDPDVPAFEFATPSVGRRR